MSEDKSIEITRWFENEDSLQDILLKGLEATAHNAVDSSHNRHSVGFLVSVMDYREDKKLAKTDARKIAKMIRSYNRDVREEG